MRARNFGLSIVFAVFLLQSVAAQSTWPTSTPLDVGLDSKVLAALDADISAGKYGYVDSVLVIRYGKIAFERTYKWDYDSIYKQEATQPGPLNAHDASGPYNYFNPWWHPYYHRSDIHTMQSVTKTITSVIIGIAIARNEFPSIDTPVLKFFDIAKVANVDDRKKRMTIRHLLTMTAGLDWNEDVPYADPKNTACLMEASFDWVQFAIDRPMLQEPGKAFQYNSGATQLLSHIFRSATGKDIEEYGEEYLFAPLGIDHYFWKRSPTGLIDTEGGLYLAPRDLAKIAYLFLKNGAWNGKTVVTSEWVNESLKPSIIVPGRDGVMYGLKWWLYRYGDKDSNHFAFGGSGFGGQRPIVIRELGLVMVFTGWNILPNKPSLTPRDAIDRVLAAVIHDK